MIKKKIILIGAGSHAFSCIDVIEQNNEYEICCHGRIHCLY